MSFYAQFEVTTPYGALYSATMTEAKMMALDAAKVTGKACAVKKVAVPFLVATGWEPESAPAAAPEPVKPACCQVERHVPHNNCMYGGRKFGHSPAHCTADACY